MLLSPVLVVVAAPTTGATGTVQSFALGTTPLADSTAYSFPLPLASGWVVQSAYLTGLEASGYSVTEQILVQQ